MPMVIKNNRSAIGTLNTLNRNSSALAKSLEKVSSGMKINGAADDASGYAISERMRVQIRGLDQANANAQNATSLMKVAEGAVSSTVDILRTLKEKAINAANDTNTDADRQTIQKELSQSIDQVDDNSQVTFNGKRLIDGSSDLPITTQEMIINALSTEWFENTLDLLEDSLGLSFRGEYAAVKEISVHFDERNSTAAAWVATTGPWRGKANSMSLHINMSFFSNLDPTNTANVNGSANGIALDRIIAHEMTHGIMASCIAGMGSLPATITEGLAELVRGDDDRLTGGLVGADPANVSGNVYAGGYVGLRYMAKQGGSNGQQVIKKFMHVLMSKGAGALDEAVSYATNGRFSSWNDVTTQFNNDQASASRANLLKYCGINLDNKDSGTITGQDAGGKYVKTDDDVVPEAGSTKFWYAPGGQYSIINGLTVNWKGHSTNFTTGARTERTTGWQAKAGNMAIQTGTKANQAIMIGFMDLSAEGLGLKAANARRTKLSIETQDKAKNAIRLLDQSIEKAIAQQTTIGALLSRMDYTSANLIEASENTYRSESAIRDADMAKEMTNYTKYNVLFQASQSMLAQANQNSSSVLGLLQ